MNEIKIRSALISVYSKDGLEPIVQQLNNQGVKIYSTGGTFDFINQLNIPVTSVESVTEYPEVFGGRVKTLHPKIFGGILHRRSDKNDLLEKEAHQIPAIDLVIVDLYPFEATVASGANEAAIIEKIDIGGIALIRAAAKNFNDVVIIPSRQYYIEFLSLLIENKGTSKLVQRKRFAKAAFNISSGYDSAIFNYLNDDGQEPAFKISVQNQKAMRYGENPHQKGAFYGDFENYFEQLSGKDISYNNLVDIEASVQLMSEFQQEIAFGILKHNNACGFALGNTVKEAYQKSFEADTQSAFGGVLVTNHEIDENAANEMNSLFFEILIAPAFTTSALSILRSKKNRILLMQKKIWDEKNQYKSILNGVLVQDYDRKTDSIEDFKITTKKRPTLDENLAMVFASKLCKHTKSNTIILADKSRMISSGVGQTSRVDALEQAIAKAGKMGFSLKGAVMASDAFFPFPDCVEIAHLAGISAVIQPGGSVKDQLSIDFCDEHDMAMVFTGFRHFKH